MPYYDILGLVGVQSQVPLRELEGFQTDTLLNRDVVINCPSLRYSPRLKRQVINGGSSSAYVEQFGSLGATVRITPGKNVQVEVNWLLKYSNAVLYVNVVEPLLRLVLAAKGSALLHGACLSRKDKAILISAPPDTGKTTTVLRCLNKGWYSFLSDDMTVVGKDERFYKFPKPFTISAHTYAATSGAHSKAKGVKGALKLRLKSLIHSRTGRRILRLIGELNVPILSFNAIGQMAVKPPKVFAEALVRGVTTTTSAQPVAVCLLRKGGEKIVPAEPGEVLEELLLNSEDAFGFPPYSDIFHKLKLYGRSSRDILSSEKALLEKLVGSVNCYRLHSDSRNWNVMVDQVMDRFSKPVNIVPPTLFSSQRLPEREQIVSQRGNE